MSCQETFCQRNCGFGETRDKRPEYVPHLILKHTENN